MKIALCLSGQPRYISEGYGDIYDKILSKYNVDTFIHTWWDESYSNKKIEFNPQLSYGRSCLWEKDTVEKILNLYRPKKIEYEPQKGFKIHEDVVLDKQSPISLYSMSYSMYKSNELKKKYEEDNNLVYDCVIKCRFDIRIPSLNLDINSIDLNKIYVSGEIKPYPNDQLIFSNSVNMDYFSELFLNIDKYYNSGYRYFVNEKIIKHHLEQGNKKLYYCDRNELYCSIVIK